MTKLQQHLTSKKNFFFRSIFKHSQPDLNEVSIGVTNSFVNVLCFSLKNFSDSAFLILTVIKSLFFGSSDDTSFSAEVQCT